MGMLQKYRNKLRWDERKKKRGLIEKGEVVTKRVKVRVPGVKHGTSS